MGKVIEKIKTFLFKGCTKKSTKEEPKPEEKPKAEENSKK